MSDFFSHDNQRPCSEPYPTPPRPVHKPGKAKGARKSTIPVSPCPNQPRTNQSCPQPITSEPGGADVTMTNQPPARSECQIRNPTLVENRPAVLRLRRSQSRQPRLSRGECCESQSDHQIRRSILRVSPLICNVIVTLRHKRGYATVHQGGPRLSLIDSDGYCRRCQRPCSSGCQ